MLPSIPNLPDPRMFRPQEVTVLNPTISPAMQFFLASLRTNLESKRTTYMNLKNQGKDIYN